MAISFRLPEPVGRDALAQAWLEVIARHGTLRTVFVESSAGPELREVQVGPGGWVHHPVGAGQAVNDALREVLDRSCSPYAAPAHRLCVLETAAGPTVVVAADHAHVDMWSLLVILRDLLALLGQAKLAPISHRRLTSPTLPGDDPVPAFAEHTSELRRRGDVPAEVRQGWADTLEASGGVMPRFPLPLGPSTPQPERVEIRDVFDADDGVAFATQARQDGVSTLALAVAAMTQVTSETAGMPLRAVFPVHSRYAERWHDSVGWFITNSVLHSAEPDPQSAAAAIKHAIRLGSWPLKEVLKPWGGMPEAPGMFAISWLDLRRLPVRVDTAALEAEYVGSVIRTDGVMLWFIFDQSGLHLRCRYPDAPLARENVGSWLDRLVDRMQTTARLSIRGVLHVGDRTYRVNRATKADIGAVVELLAGDALGQRREVAELAPYEAAFDALARDRSHHLTLVRDEEDRIVGTMQLTLIPGLSRGGTTRLQIEGLRVAVDQRSRGIGTAMVQWAHDHGRARGATLAQVVTDQVRERARAFYARLGYETGQVGLKREL